MSSSESSPRSVPSYKMESVLGKLRHHMIEPAASRLSPVAKALEPVTLPVRRAGHELRTSLTHEGEVRRRAEAIGEFKSYFDTAEQEGSGLMERGMRLLDAADSLSPGSAQRDQALADLQEVMRQIGYRAPGTGVDRIFVNPTQDSNITESFRGIARDMMAGYLLHRNALLFQQEGKTLDEEKAKRQVKGIASMLLGHHVHMGTGEGKSTVVLPIVSLVESRTSTQKDVILSTASDESLSELRGHVERLARELPPAMQSTLDAYRYTLEDGQDKETVAQLQKDMQREAILNGGYSEALHKRIRNLYWKSQMKSVLAPSRSDMVQKKNPAARVLFAAERDVVFAYEEDPDRFVKNAPPVLMDEADIPYRRHTPYVTTTEAQYYSPEEIRDSMGTWLMHYLVNDRIRYPTADDPGDFTPTQYGFKLTAEAQARLKRLNLRTLVNHYGGKDALNRSFRKGVALIASELGIEDGEERGRIEKSMIKWLRTTLPSDRLEPQEEGVQVPEGERLTEMQQTVQAIAERLGSQYYQKGIGYLMEEGSGEVKIRDAYIDDLLEGHRHESLTTMSILAMSGRYSFVPPYRTSGRSVYFQTFASDIGDKLRCASGSLMFPDLLTGRIKKDAFAAFLEEATGKHVVLISPPDIKRAPAPHIFKTQASAIERLVKDVSGRQQPRLVICYDRLEGQALYEQFARENPGKKIVYVPIHPAQQEVAAYCRDLAEGKVDILVSAGNLGFGVNIVEGSGRFPDLHVSILGLPENQLQVVQAIGRRRKAGNDFSWYVGEPAVYKYIADFKSDTSWRERVIQGYLSVDQMMKGYKEVEADPAKGLQFVVDLLAQHELLRRSDDVYVTYFDASMEKIRRYAFPYLRELIKSDIAEGEKEVEYHNVLHALETQMAATSEFFEGPVSEAPNPRLAELERQVSWMKKNTDMLVAQYGLPDSLDDYMQHEIGVTAGSLQAQTMRDLVENKFMRHVFGTSFTGGPNLVQEYVNEWYRSRRDSMREMSRVLSNDYRLQMMTPMVLRQAKAEFAPFMGDAQIPNIDAVLNQAFRPLPVSVQADPTLQGAVLGTFNANGKQLLAIRRGTELLLVNTFRSGIRDFNWEDRSVGNLVGIQYLGKPIGNEEKETENVYYLWTNR